MPPSDRYYERRGESRPITFIGATRGTQRCSSLCYSSIPAFWYNLKSLLLPPLLYPLCAFAVELSLSGAFFTSAGSRDRKEGTARLQCRMCDINYEMGINCESLHPQQLIVQHLCDLLYFRFRLVEPVTISYALLLVTLSATPHRIKVGKRDARGKGLGGSRTNLTRLAVSARLKCMKTCSVYTYVKFCIRQQVRRNCFFFSWVLIQY